MSVCCSIWNSHRTLNDSVNRTQTKWFTKMNPEHSEVFGVDLMVASQCHSVRLALCGGQSSPPLGIIALFFLRADVSSRAHSGFVVNLDQSSLSNYCTKSCCQQPISARLPRMCARLCVFVMRWGCPQQHYCLLFFWNVRPLKHSLPVLACACYRHLCVCMRASGVYGLSICNAISIRTVCLHAAWMCMFANLLMAWII